MTDGGAKLALFEAVRDTTARFEAYKKAWLEYDESQLPAGSPLAEKPLKRIKETLSAWGNAWETRARGVSSLGLNDRDERAAALRDGAQFLEKALVGYSKLNEQAEAHGVRRFVPSDEAFDELQALLCSLDPERASDLWARFDAAGLPTGGFVRGKTDAMVAPPGADAARPKPTDEHQAPASPGVTPNPPRQPPPSPPQDPEPTPRGGETPTEATGPSSGREGKSPKEDGPGETPPVSGEGTAKGSATQDGAKNEEGEPSEAKGGEESTGGWLSKIPALPAAAWYMLREAAKVVPVLNFAIGVVGAVAAGSLAVWLFAGDGRAAVIGFILVIAGMVLLLIVGGLAKSKPEAFRAPARVITWVITILFSVVLTVGTIVKTGEYLHISPTVILHFAEYLGMHHPDGGPLADASAPPPRTPIEVTVDFERASTVDGVHASRALRADAGALGIVHGGARVPSPPLNGPYTIVPGVPGEWEGELVRLELDAPPYVLVAESALQALEKRVTVRLDVDLSRVYSGTVYSTKPTFGPAKAAIVRLDFVNCPPETTNDAGYFDFGWCDAPELRSGPPPTVTVTLPGSATACSKIALNPIGKSTRIEVSGHCAQKSTASGAHQPSCNPAETIAMVQGALPGGGRGAIYSIDQAGYVTWSLGQPGTIHYEHGTGRPAWDCQPAPVGPSLMQ